MLIFPILLSLFIYIFACLGLGTLLLSILTYKPANSRNAAEITTCFLLGQGIIANVWVFISLTGNFSNFIVKSILVFLAIIGIILNHKLINFARKQIVNIWNDLLIFSWSWKLIILATLTMWLAWVTSIGRPPTMDGTRFYLALPKVIAESGYLKVLPGYEEVASLGLQGEMHFAALMTLGSPESTQLFSWITLTAGSVLLLALAKQLGLGRHAQWIIIAMIFTSSAVIELSGSGKIDIYGVAFAFAAYYWAFNIEKENYYLSSILTGLFSGLALVAKVSYAANFLPSLIVILIWKLFTRSDENKIKEITISLALVSAGAIFIFLQMPIKNQILFQNPLAPYGMTDLFEQTWYGPETIRQIRLTLPLALTFGDYWAQIGGLSPLILMFVPLIFFLSKPQNPLKSPVAILSFAAVFGLFCWLLYRPATFAPRYFLGCILLVTVPISKAVEAFTDEYHSANRFILTTTFISIVSTGLFYSVHVFLPKQTFDLLMYNQPDCAYDPVQCEISNHLNKIISPGERIFTNDFYRYWLRADLIQCALTSSELGNYFSLQTSEQRWRFIIGRGFQSVLFYNRDIPISNKIREDLLEIPPWLDIKQIKTIDDLNYFQLIPKEGSSPILYECRQVFHPAWDVIELETQ